MVIEKIKSKLPKKDESLQKVFEFCTKRKKIIQDTEGHSLARLEKAKHDLSRAFEEIKANSFDWTVIKAYYAIHHAGNALLSKKRQEFSKDHQCLIVALHHFNLIPSNLFQELKKIDERFSDVLSLDIGFELRKISQYGVDGWKEISRKDAEMLLDVARKFVEFVESQVI